MKVTSRTRQLLDKRRASRKRHLREAVQRDPAMVREDRDSWRARRWDAADTNRLNKAHWQGAYGRTINEDLLDRLETLRIRSEYEIANDPILEGVVSTFANDVAPAAPRVQVQSDSEEYNTAVEEAIEEYHERPDPTREQSMAEVLRVDVRGLCSAGEFIHQFTNTRRRGPFEFAIRSLHPRRLETPIDRAGDPYFFMGLELEESGRVLRHWFRDEPPGLLARSTMNWRSVDSQNIQHRFISYEPDQLRGFPLIAVSLPNMANRRDLNAYVIEAAKNAAAQGVYWYTNNLEAILENFQICNETRKLEPGTEQFGPPGYQPAMLSPTQPAANWKEFEHEQLRGYGRPFGMPLMMVLLSSEGNSFSGANHDGQIYIRTVTSLQSWLACGTLTPQYRQIATEVAIARGLRVPKRVHYSLTWVKPPHPDPKKNYEALRMQLEDGAIALSDVCAALDKDFETVQEAREYVNEVLEKRGMPYPPINVGSAAGRPSDILRDIAEQLDSTDPSEDGPARSRVRRYDPSQPRDEDGKWDETGGGGGSSSSGKGGGRSTKEAKPRTRAERAKAAYNPSTKAKQDESEAAERAVAKKLGGTKSGDNAPMDIVLSGKHGVELKVMHDAKEGRVNMRPDSRSRKEAWQKAGKGRSLHTVLIDNRDKFDGGRHAAKYSGHKIYYAAGVGAFRLANMTKVKSYAELKKLIGSNSRSRSMDLQNA